MNNFTFRYYPNPIPPGQKELEKKIFRYSFIIPSIFLLTIWMIKFIEITLDLDLSALSMYPRHKEGLLGILTSPLVHADWGHLTGNSTSFLVLATALFYFYRNMAMKIFSLNYFMSGLFLWLGGREVHHIGASGIIYGLITFLLFSGIFRRDTRLLTVSLIVTFLYGSFVWGLFPIEEHISWDGHLMGAVSGTILSLIFYKYGPPREKFEWEEEDETKVETEIETETDKEDE